MATPNDLDPRAVMRNRSLAQALSTGIDQANLVLLGSALASADTFAARLRFGRFIGMVSARKTLFPSGVRSAIAPALCAFGPLPMR